MLGIDRTEGGQGTKSCFRWAMMKFLESILYGLYGYRMTEFHFDVSASNAIPIQLYVHKRIFILPMEHSVKNRYLNCMFSAKPRADRREKERDGREGKRFGWKSAETKRAHKKRETTVDRRCMETAVGMAGLMPGFMCVLDSFASADVVLYAL